MKQNKSLMIFLSCASGAGIGYLLAVRFGVHLWWLGVLVGGVIGYLVYDIKQIVESIPRAWQYAKEKSQLNVDRKTVMVILKETGVLVYVLFTALFLQIMYGPLAKKFLTTHGIRIDNNSFAESVIGLICFFGCALSLSLYFNYRTRKKVKDYESDKVFLTRLGLYQTLKFAERNFFTYLVMSILGSPIVLVLIIWNILSIIINAILLVPSLVKFTTRFLWKAFKLIHSDLRILVLVYSVTGGTIGYFCHSILFGMLVGGIGGVVTYKLISILWLKLQPKN